MPDIERPVFIVGAGRSGTTLLRSLLSAHSRIAVTPETHYMKWIDRHGALRNPKQDFSDLWGAYMETWRFESLGVSEEQCRQTADELGGATCRNAFLAMLAAYGQRLGKPRVGEKSPSHVRYLDRLFEWYPDARVIVTQRDPRAVLASKLRNPWVTRRLTPFSVRQGLLVGSRIHAVAREAYDWSCVHQHIVPQWEGDPRVYVVAYESLVRDPEREVRAMCDLLGEAFEPTMLTDRSNETVPMPTEGAPDARLAGWGQEHHAKTLRPISNKSVDKWKSELSARDVALIEGVCEEGMARTGYAPVTSALNHPVGRAMARAVVGGEEGEAAIRARARTARRRLKDLTG